MGHVPSRQRAANDSGRRERLIDATIEVLASHGLEGLSARRVVSAAEAPLSAIAYYFGALDRLLEAAFVELIARDLEALRSALDSVPAGGDIVDGLVRYVADSVNSTGFLVSAPLWVAAARRNSLRRLASDWDIAWSKLISSRMTPWEADIANAVITRELVRSLVSSPMRRSQFERTLRAALSPPAGQRGRRTK